MDGLQGRPLTMCSCQNITPQSVECYSQMITVDIPDHMESYKSARINGGLTGRISIDPCIIGEIQLLWSKGIHTHGSCCGHNIMESMVNVADKDIRLMLDLGYIQNHPDKNREDTFKLKSV